MTTETALLDDIILSLPSTKDNHLYNSPLYHLLDGVAKREVNELFKNCNTEKASFHFGPFGPFIFPYFKMGAIDSRDLFGLDELILFSFYWTNRNRYKKVLDIGANIGLHSAVLAKSHD